MCEFNHALRTCPQSYAPVVLSTNVNALVGTNLRERAQACEQVVLDHACSQTIQLNEPEPVLAHTLAVIQHVGAGATCVRGEHNAVLIAVLCAVAFAKFQIELQKRTCSEDQRLRDSHYGLTSEAPTKLMFSPCASTFSPLGLLALISGHL